MIRFARKIALERVLFLYSSRVKTRIICGHDYAMFSRGCVLRFCSTLRSASSDSASYTLSLDFVSCLYLCISKVEVPSTKGTLNFVDFYPKVFDLLRIKVLKKPSITFPFSLNKGQKASTPLRSSVKKLCYVSRFNPPNYR